ncbi:MAG TPA: methylmalonyl-CoA mutase family protein [Leptospiraceae bacterium]|nr:methylmalonyl-CoA mutase family protein [Leptospiraceae bacterium]HNF26891.1 methylmalonyl-CoA mutase family protein [Leptospiraceae bacterium]
MTGLPEIAKTANRIRVLTSASLFDGHDASINIMRRILTSSGAEVIHLGHNRSAEEIARAAVQEDVHCIALTSYQGGHVEFFSYIKDLLKKFGSPHIRIFGGGGGTILPSEADYLHTYGIDRIYSPDDGRSLGLQGMINDLLIKSDCSVIEKKLQGKDSDSMTGRVLSFIELDREIPSEIIEPLQIHGKRTAPVIGITGTGGAGKSSFTDEMIRNLTENNPGLKIAVLSVDPTRKKTGGALLGDRIRFNSARNRNVFLRSIATHSENSSISPSVKSISRFLKNSIYDLVFLETAGTGQSDSQVTDVSDFSIYVMTPEYGADTQLEKIGMLDYADMVVINKSDRKGAADARKSVAKQIQRNRGLFSESPESMPVFSTVASQFNHPGIIEACRFLSRKISGMFSLPLDTFNDKIMISENKSIIPPSRVRYLSEIRENSEEYCRETEIQSEAAEEIYSLEKIISRTEEGELKTELNRRLSELQSKLSAESKKIISEWETRKKNYESQFYSYTVRGKEIRVPNFSSSLSGLRIPKVCLPEYRNYGDILKWAYSENVPGEFPYTAGVYPFKRTNEDPIRMFAGEGSPERTNRRFHYLSKGQPAVRLSTAFDSVTLYGEDPEERPDIYGKIGNSGVSICSLDDMKRLYSGFRLTENTTSVSMTINGPAPMLLAFFMNTAADQECEIYIRENGLLDAVERKKKEKYGNGLIPEYREKIPEGHDGLGLLLLGLTGREVLPADVYDRIRKETVSKVRGTVQADILKEDQAQNTCIFSSEFALKLMGDVQEYFIEKDIRNFYSVSISGYHIAEAGANPVTQLALTLANGFTYVEYYLSRGMKIDDFAPNFSFFFSNGMDPEYSVIGRAARRIWAKAIRFKYKGNERSQMLKYHIQTSGRSLHAQEIDFNDIRTTLQALYAISDNCNSLHTNAYDEAITTPTEESVRRAVAIQMIINRELGTAKNENPLQGSFFIEKLTDMVEQAVYEEFDRITERGGVLGAMETMYQRNKIQEESLYYENLKQTGEYPIIGVNTFLSSKGSPTVIPGEVIRASEEEKKSQVKSKRELHSVNSAGFKEKTDRLKNSAFIGENIFSVLMDVCPFLSLGQMTEALYQAGGEYRRGM